jgi:hypothetical protein
MKVMKLSTFLVIFIFAVALASSIKAQSLARNMKTFLNSQVPGIKVQVNATAETQPTRNITVILTLTADKNVTVVKLVSLNFSIFGFLNGTDKFLMESIPDHDVSLNPQASISYTRAFEVPSEVWDTTYGEIVLTYNATYRFGPIYLTDNYDSLTVGFTMTHVKNVYVEELQNSLAGLKEEYQQLNNSFWQLNGTYWRLNATYKSLDETFMMLQQNYASLQKNYTALKGSTDDTRTVATFLGITTVFFVATTVYMIMRRPREYW